MSRDVSRHNREAWDECVLQKNPWTLPVDRQAIAQARDGRPRILLTPEAPLPLDWLPGPDGKHVLCLAASGGQQAPLLAAYGYAVTVLDNSPRQLAQDKLVAERENLAITRELGSMTDLGRFENESFDIIVHPVSNCFVEDVRAVWREVFRVLKPGGALLAGFMNPAFYIFDFEEEEKNERLIVKHHLPYSDTRTLTDEQMKKLVSEKRPLEFSHSLTDQIGGQLEAGFSLRAFFEDSLPGSLASEYFPPCLATYCTKPV